MSYTKFADYYAPAANDVASSTSFKNAELGIQAEFEDRQEATLLNGVISGLACTISGTTIGIASGEAYCEGKRYAGSSSVEFVGSGSGIYNVYIDPTDNTTPYKATTSAITVAQLILCTVTWNGTDTLSALLDKREWGCIPFWFPPLFKVGSVATGLLGILTAPADLWLEDMKITCATSPTGSSVIVDLRVGDSGVTPTTVYTITTYRPAFTTTASTWTVVGSTGYINGTNRKVSAGQNIAVYVDQTDSSAQATGLAVTVRGRIYGKSL